MDESRPSGRDMPSARPSSLHVAPSSDPDTVHAQISGSLVGDLHVAVQIDPVDLQRRSARPPPPLAPTRCGPLQVDAGHPIAVQQIFAFILLQQALLTGGTAIHRGSAVSLMPSVTNCAVRL